MGAEDVAGPRRGGEPVRGVVGQVEALVVVVEGQCDQDRAEDLVLDDLGVLRGVDDERRLVVGAAPPAPAGHAAAGDDLGAGRRARSTIAGDPVAVRRRRSAAEVGGRVVGSPSTTADMSVGDAGDEGVVERALHVGAGGRGAVLPGVDQRAGDRAVGRGVEVGVVEDDEGRLAAELEVDPLDGAGGQRADPLPDARSSR